MEFKEYSKAVMAWVDGVMQNRGADAEKTLKYCADIEQYAKQTGIQSFWGLPTIMRARPTMCSMRASSFLRPLPEPSPIWIRRSSGTWLPGLIISFAIAFLNRGNTPIALDYYLTGLGYCKKYKLANEENVINPNLGTLYLGNEQWNEAQRYFEKVSSDIKAYPETPELLRADELCSGLSGAVLYAAGTE